MIRLVTLLALVSVIAFASKDTGQVTGEQAAKDFSNFGSRVDGEQNCVMHFEKKAGGLLIYINSTEESKTLGSTFISKKAPVEVFEYKAGNHTETSYTYNYQERRNMIFLTTYDDLSDFDLTITMGKKAVRCSFKE